MGEVNADLPAVGAGARVQVAAPLAGVFGRQAKCPQRMPLPGGQVEQVEILVPVFAGVGVAEDPAIPWQIGAMPVGFEHALDHFRAVGEVFKNLEAPGLGFSPIAGVGENTLRVAPDKVGDVSAWDQQVQPRAIGAGGEHSGLPAFALGGAVAACALGAGGPV